MKPLYLIVGILLFSCNLSDNGIDPSPSLTDADSKSRMDAKEQTLDDVGGTIEKDMNIEKDTNNDASTTCQCSDTCQSLGFESGNLSCTGERCDVDTSKCIPFATCGNGVLDANEFCDGPALNGATCQTAGFEKGAISCSSNCTLDTSLCIACGNNKVENGEECEVGLLGESCSSLGYAGGRLLCTSCEYDESECNHCGDGILDAGEVCDGSAFSQAPVCGNFGFSTGTVTCSDLCTVDLSDCSTCGDGVLHSREVCDTTAFGTNNCRNLRGPGYGGELSCDNTCSSFDADSCELRVESLEAGGHCGIYGLDIDASNGSLACWGTSPLPTGVFERLSSSETHHCAINIRGEIECWGDNTYGQTSHPTTGSFRHISVTNDSSCALKGTFSSGTIECWGKSFPDSLPTGNYRGIAISPAKGCVIKSDSTLECWGWGNVAIPTNTFRSIRMGTDHGCGIDMNRNIHCWGPTGAIMNVPTGSFGTLDVGDDHACATRYVAGGGVVCWGNNTNGKATPPPANQFTYVNTGKSHSCGASISQGVQCWGSVVGP